MHSDLVDLEKRLSKIEKRNDSVSLDKKREQSWVRKVVIVVITYIFIGLYMRFLGVYTWYFHALIPTFGFILSSLSLDSIQKIRMKGKNK